MTAKENAPVFETEAPSATAPLDSTPDAPRETTRPLFHALTWRGADPQQQDGDEAPQTPDPLLGWHALAAPAKAKLPRGKHRRNARREAIASKRHQAGIADFELIAITAWLVVVLCAAAEAIGRVLQ